MRSPVRVLVGQTHQERTIGPLTLTDVVRFAGAGGDFNPLHHDSEFVTAAGFPAIVSMGQLQAGMLAGWLSDWVGVEHVREYEIRFVAPVFVGDVLTFGGKVSAIRQQGVERLATIELSAAKGDGTAVVLGKAAVVVDG
ncbi:MaoC/PaaZ C-terminal domain-containing protein [Nocardia sp. NPDC004860]|uniref:MaoC/PaaZ C-terminal domain-containing protein n=1 Tax=Nocardia sp. NPDC004860 TaxID=3154557 RepID=UPI0033A0BE9F